MARRVIIGGTLALFLLGVALSVFGPSAAPQGPGGGSNGNGGGFGATMGQKADEILAGLSQVATWLDTGPSAAPRRVDNPETLRERRMQGYAISPPGVAGPDLSVVQVGDILTGFPDDPVAEIPGTPVLVAPGCTVPAPPPGARVVPVHVSESPLPAELYALDPAALAAPAEAWLAARLADPMTALPAPGAASPMGRVTVTVTATDAPLYLVLQGAAAPLVWSLQVADDVEVAQVVTLGSPGTALHGLPAGTGFTAIDLTCGPAIARAPAPHWLIYETLKAPKRLARAEETAARAYLAYDTWFQEQFGHSSEAGAVGALRTGYALVGPVPATPLAYQPLSHGRVHATPATMLVAGPAEAAAIEIAAARQRLAERALGGPLSSLIPAAMERQP